MTVGKRVQTLSLFLVEEAVPLPGINKEFLNLPISSRGSTATPGSSSMLSYTRETLSEMIANTVPDGGGIATLATTNKTGRGDNVTPSNKTGRQHHSQQ